MRQPHRPDLIMRIGLYWVPLTAQFKRVYHLVNLRTGCAEFFIPRLIQCNILAFLLRADARAVAGFI